MPRYEYKVEICNSALYVGDFMKSFFKSQGIEPYLPLKSDIVRGIKQVNYEGNFGLWNYAMPYDIESEHIRKHRDEIRLFPVEFNWTDSELREYESLPSDDLRRCMILDKVDMKSLYLPKLRYEQDFIEYPPLPSNERAKNDFAKGFELYNKGYDNEEMRGLSIPYLESSASAGNYISHEILSRYYLDKLGSCDSMEDVLWERSAKSFMHHCKWLQNMNLPVGYYLMSRYHKHYLSINRDKIRGRDYDIMYDERIYPNMIKALELGSHDLMWELATSNRDLEWALSYMLLTGDSNVLNGIIGSARENGDLSASPRNIATMKLGIMLGSHSAIKHTVGLMTGCLFHKEYKECYFFQDFIEKDNYLLLSTTGMHSDKTKCQSYKYLCEKSFLVPDIDKLIPASTILYTPYCSLDRISYLRGNKYNKLLSSYGYHRDPKNFSKDKMFEIYKDFPYKDPRSSYSTMEQKIEFRKLMRISETYNSLDDGIRNENREELEETFKKFGCDDFKVEYEEILKDNIDELVERSEEGMISEEVYDFIGYANALKKRELEMNPHYYKLARPYIFPEEVYKDHPEWY